MPTRAVFRCQFCDAVPDHGTQRSLAGQVTERMFGEYLDAFPGRWLVWNGGGPLGPRRYACREHRGELVAYLRYHYATVAAQVWKMPPYPQRWPDEKRPHMGGSMGVIKFGLRGGLLQDRPPAELEDDSRPHAGQPGSQPPVGDTLPAGSAAAGPDAARAGQAEPPDAAGTQPEGQPASPAEAAESAEASVGPAPGEGPASPDEAPPGASDWPENLFPPGELYLPTDGPFAPEGGSRSPERDDLGPWIPGAGESWPDDGPAPDGTDLPDDGPWPAGPDQPSG
jgi:hypothetical protein